MATIEKKIKDLSPEELRQYKRDSAARARAHKPEKQAQKKFETAIAACRTLQEFWAVNKEKDTDVVAALQPQVELAANQFYWMNSGWRFADDPDYVDLREGTADLNRFIREQGGLIKEHKFTDEDLNEYRPGFAIWADFWRDTKMFDALVKENKPTELYARYGIAISVFEHAHIVFTQNIRRHREACPGPNVFTSGWKNHVEYEGDRCWLCQFKAFHGRDCEE
jgi:hypothetical protein